MVTEDVVTHSCSLLPTLVQTTPKNLILKAFCGELQYLFWENSAISAQNVFILKDPEQVTLWQIPFGWLLLQFCKSFPIYV